MNKTTITKSELSSDVLTDEALEKINRFSRKTLTKDDVYTFPIILCDNEIDRDLEKFGTEALRTLADLFVGKTGLFDHSFSGRDQTARIYSAEYRTDPTLTTQTGEAYAYILAHAYMPRIAKNESLIAEIESGIKKETSVGCAVAEKRCSVCGADVLHAPCAHVKGETYDGQLCHHILCAPTDAYEWSFVAVPAQRKAGVTKAYTEKEIRTAMQDVLKTIRAADGALTLNETEVQSLRALLDTLQSLSALGKAYRDDLADEALRAGLAAMPDMDGDVLRSLCDKATVPELKAMRKCFGTLSSKRTVIPLQLCTPTEEAESNTAFQI